MEHKLLVIGFLSILLIACKGETKTKETLYLPYMDGCSDKLEWTKSFILQIDPSARMRRLEVSDRFVFHKYWDKLVEVELSLPVNESVDAAIGTYLLDCGPNRSVAIKSESYLKLEHEVERNLGFNLVADSRYKIKFDNEDGIVILVTEKLE